MFLRFEHFRRFMHEAPLARLSAELMGAARLNLYRKTAALNLCNTRV